jgi:hypothetical protein
MTKSISGLNTSFVSQRISRGLASREVSQIEEAVKDIEGWTAEVFDCQCCGKTTARVVPICEPTDGLEFEITRDGSQISVTTTLPDGDEHVCEFSSVPAALGGMRVTIASATDPRWKCTRKVATAA